jgi:hypothetical protein
MEPILCNPVSFDEMVSKKKREETEYKPEIWQHVWKTMEVMSKQRGRISLEYKPYNGGYDSKYSGKWKMTFMGATYSNADPIQLVAEVTKVFCRVYGIDYEKILAEKEAAIDGTDTAT